MKVPKQAALAFALSLAWPLRGAAEPVAERWQARAARAAGALTQIEAQMAALRKQGVKRSSERFRELELAAMLERAFAEHADRKRAGELHRVLPGGDESFVLVLRPKRRTMFTISYVYDASGRSLGVRILALPENWSVLVPERSADKERRLLVDPGVPGTQVIPLFVFDLDDACSSFVKLGP
ncbi:MAG TPA: hypothetical protein VMT17_02780 [Anaeromyxobacteraceae bacterium]|nr:hypothetical protein [Anaeromyxobacteraceae bacterium]